LSTPLFVLIRHYSCGICIVTSVMHHCCCKNTCLDGYCVGIWSPKQKISCIMHFLVPAFCRRWTRNTYIIVCWQRRRRHVMQKVTEYISDK
jgi:hypothetical protein